MYLCLECLHLLLLLKYCCVPLLSLVKSCVVFVSQGKVRSGLQTGGEGHQEGLGRKVHQGVLSEGEGKRPAGDRHHEQPPSPQTGAVYRCVRGQI